ncbi:MAG TPA: hypothetical protein VEL28_16915 [Candidatus Binatia bacterium]|nr:hypothetical protein [Candidatus Binatia bacterium]
MDSGTSINVTIAIDLEPDARMIARNESGAWRGFEILAEALTALRARLPGKDGQAATFTWLMRMDPQIGLAYGDAAYGVRRYRRLIDGFEAAGDDLGTHVHLYDWDLDEQRWVTDFSRPEWARTCVDEAVGTFRDLFSRPPRAHSFGDRYCSEAILDQLEEAGIQCDMTTESGLGCVHEGFPNELHRGEIPDTRRAPRDVWRPARDHWLRHDPDGGRRLQMMPISTYRFPQFFEAGRWLDMQRRRRRGRPGSMDEREQRYARLCLEHRSYVFRYGLRQLRQEFAPRHLQFVLNSSQARDAATLRRYFRSIEYLCSAPGGRRYEFVSAMGSLAAV